MKGTFSGWRRREWMTTIADSVGSAGRQKRKTHADSAKLKISNEWRGRVRGPTHLRPAPLFCLLLKGTSRITRIIVSAHVASAGTNSSKDKKKLFPAAKDRRKRERNGYKNQCKIYSTEKRMRAF